MAQYFKKVEDGVTSKEELDKMVMKLSNIQKDENLREVKILLDNNPQIKKLDHDLFEDILKNNEQKSPRAKKRELEKHASELSELENKIKLLKRRMHSKKSLILGQKSSKQLNLLKNVEEVKEEGDDKAQNTRESAQQV